MIYYKDTNNKPYAFENNVTPEIIAKVEATHNTTLTQITEAEHQQMIAPTFKQLQVKKISEIKQAFSNALQQGYLCSNLIKMDATMEAISMLNSGYTLASKAGATTMDIRDYNNVVHSGIALSDIQTMLLELGNNFQTQLQKKWDLEAQTNNATTQEDLDAIVWS